MKVVIFIGSESDYEVVQDAIQIFQEFEISFDLEVTSAHRSPKRTENLVKEFEKQGVEIFIAVAGKAAHLAGMVAAHTVLPVIGVPVRSSSLSGLDALLSTSQMPKGIPVACMGIGKSGASNAALLSIQILALKDLALKEKIEAYRRQMASKVEEASKKIRENL
jgi:phosphoribosylaminoimidazole carboxylase PurE protein